MFRREEENQNMRTSGYCMENLKSNLPKGASFLEHPVGSESSSSSSDEYIAEGEMPVLFQAASSRRSASSSANSSSEESSPEATDLESSIFQILIQSEKVDDLILAFHHQFQHAEKEFSSELLDVFYKLPIEQQFTILESPYQPKTEGATPVYFGQPGTMSKEQLQTYLKWLLTKVEDYPEKVLCFLEFANISYIPFASYVAEVDENDELSTQYLSLLEQVLAWNIDPEKGSQLASRIINQLTTSSRTTQLMTSLLLDRKSKLIDEVLSLLAQCLNKSKHKLDLPALILNNIFKENDFFIKLLDSDRHRNKTLNLFSALQNILPPKNFIAFLASEVGYEQSGTTKQVSIAQELDRKIGPTFLGGYKKQLTNERDERSFDELERYREDKSLNSSTEDMPTASAATLEVRIDFSKVLNPSKVLERARRGYDQHQRELNKQRASLPPVISQEERNAAIQAMLDNQYKKLYPASLSRDKEKRNILNERYKKEAEVVSLFFLNRAQAPLKAKTERRVHFAP